MSENYQIRKLDAADQTFLWEMLYQSLYVVPGGGPYPREILKEPEVARYVEAWGREGDLGFAALDPSRGEAIGAAWLRLMKGAEKGYGYVDDDTPELGMAVLPEYRGRGAGSELLNRVLNAASSHYRKVSLSVSAENPALRLYERAGFVRARNDGSSVVMVRSLT